MIMETPEFAADRKRCWACGQVKLLRAFPVDRSRPDGRGGRCRVCDRAKAAAYRAADLEQERARQREYKRRVLGCQPRRVEAS